MKVVNHEVVSTTDEKYFKCVCGFRTESFLEFEDHLGDILE